MVHRRPFLQNFVLSLANNLFSTHLKKIDTFSFTTTKYSIYVSRNSIKVHTCISRLLFNYFNVSLQHFSFILVAITINRYIICLVYQSHISHRATSYNKYLRNTLTNIHEIHFHHVFHENS